MTIFNNLSKLKKQMISCERQAVCLLAVSKTKSISAIEEAIDAGQFVFGENYVQEAIEKMSILDQKHAHLEWHYIGRIQTRKINDLARHFDWVQTIENQEAAQKLNDACEKLNRKINVCLQVNVSNEIQKGGIQLHDVNRLATYVVEECSHLCLRGLMTIGLATQDEALLRAMFCQLKVCFDALKRQYVSVDTLSMGMSSDMGLAIECGSTMVRIGTAIFGERR